MTFEELKILGDSLNTGNGLSNRDAIDGYLDWEPGSESATLDGHFTAKELIAIAHWMQEHTEETS